jgi:hypothetical protein
MSLIKRLQAPEINECTTLSVSNGLEQQYFLLIDETLEKKLSRLRHPLAYRFSVAGGYFKAVGLFFDVADL